MELTGDDTGRNLRADCDDAASGADNRQEHGATDGRHVAAGEGHGGENGASSGGRHGDDRDGASGGGHGDDRDGAAGADSGRKRSKKKKGRDLAELLSRKNELLQELENRLAEAEQLNAKLEDRLLRLAAEFENFRKRTRREWELHEKMASAGLIRGLLVVLDDFDRAFAASGAAEGDHFKDGMMLIYASFIDVLKRSGLSEIEARGATFDPQYHEAVGEMESAEVEAGRIADVVQKGYMFHDQVLRPARVIVARGTP